MLMRTRSMLGHDCQSVLKDLGYLLFIYVFIIKKTECTSKIIHGIKLKLPIIYNQQPKKGHPYGKNLLLPINNIYFHPF